MKNSTLLVRLDNYLRLNFDSHMNVQSIANNLYCDVSTLRRQVKKQTGMPPKDYFKFFRIKQAKKLLSQGLTPTQIYQKAGFSSAKSLSTIFKRYEMMTPTEYALRKNNSTTKYQISKGAI